MNASPQPSDSSVTFFLDRTHQSNSTAKLLRKLGVHVELHQDHFVQEAPDPEWIPVCASNGWIILSGDKGLESVGINRAVVIQSAAKVFLIHDHRTRGLEQTAALIAARKKIAKIALQNVGPFYCSIEMANDTHVGAPRFQPGGFAIKQQSVPEAAIPAPSNETQEEGASRPLPMNRNLFDQ